MSGRKAWKEEGTSDGGKLILGATNIADDGISKVDDYLLKFE